MTSRNDQHGTPRYIQLCCHISTEFKRFGRYKIAVEAGSISLERFKIAFIDASNASNNSGSARLSWLTKHSKQLTYGRSQTGSSVMRAVRALKQLERRLSDGRL